MQNRNDVFVFRCNGDPEAIVPWIGIPIRGATAPFSYVVLEFDREEGLIEQRRAAVAASVSIIDLPLYLKNYYRETADG